MPYPLAAVRNHGGNAPAIPITYLLRDQFTTNASAPLASPRTCEPGPGTLTIVDASNKVSISGSALSFTGSGGFYDTGYYGAVQTRAPGIATFVAPSSLVGSPAPLMYLRGATLGSPAVGGVADLGILVSGGAYRCYVNAVLIDSSPIDNIGTVIGIILRTAGGFFVNRVGGVWKLVWVDNAQSTASLRPGFASGSTQTGTFDNLVSLQLLAPFNTDYGVATQQLAGARSVGDTFTHEADCWVDFTITTLPSAGNIDVLFRYQDASNYWICRVNSSGDISLQQVLAGVTTQYGNAAGVVSNGHRCMILADGATLRGYSNNASRWSYAFGHSGDFKFSTQGKLNDLGTGGAVSNIVAWPRSFSGLAQSVLDTASFL